MINRIIEPCTANDGSSGKKELQRNAGSQGLFPGGGSPPELNIWTNEDTSRGKQSHMVSGKTGRTRNRGSSALSYTSNSLTLKIKNSQDERLIFQVFPF